MPNHGVVGYIRRYWEPMARHGTTWSQLKAYGGMQSHSHAWSAHPLYHLMQILGGIRQKAAGWTEIEFRPSLDGDFAEVTVPTPHGAVVSSWHRDGSAYRAVLSVPDGITARVILPGVDEVIRCAGQYRWVV